MTDKEIREIRRRFRHSKNNIMFVKGCIVDRERNIKSYIYQSMINSISEDCDKLLGVLKKVLSGSYGSNLYNLEYSSQDVMNNEEHSLLMELRNSGLNNDDALNVFYQKIIDSLHIENEYAILLAYDNYDVFNYNEDGSREEDSTSVFNYIICAVCPIKESKPVMYYSAFDNTFRMTDNHSLLSPPEIGFMFPSFDDRTANIYKSHLYTKNSADNHPDFIKNVFNVNVPKPCDEQKECFGACLTETLSEDCNLKVLKSVHDHISDMITEHKETKQEEPLTLSKNSFKNVLSSCGVAEEKVTEFENKFEEEFGKNAEIAPDALFDVKKFEVSTPYVTIKVSPDRSDLISTEIINGSRYILIRANDGVEVNGVNIN